MDACGAGIHGNAVTGGNQRTRVIMKTLVFSYLYLPVSQRSLRLVSVLNTYSHRHCSPRGTRVHVQGVRAASHSTHQKSSIVYCVEEFIPNMSSPVQWKNIKVWELVSSLGASPDNLVCRPCRQDATRVVSLYT